MLLAELSGAVGANDTRFGRGVLDRSLERRSSVSLGSLQEKQYNTRKMAAETIVVPGDKLPASTPILEFSIR